MGEISDLLSYTDPFEYEPNEFGSLSVTCKYCGKPFLNWYVDPQTKQWRLYDSNRVLHSCDEYKRSLIENLLDRIKK